MQCKHYTVILTAYCQHLPDRRPPQMAINEILTTTRPFRDGGAGEAPPSSCPSHRPSQRTILQPHVGGREVRWFDPVGQLTDVMEIHCIPASITRYTKSTGEVSGVPAQSASSFAIRARLVRLSLPHGLAKLYVDRTGWYDKRKKFMERLKLIAHDYRCIAHSEFGSYAFVYPILDHYGNAHHATVKDFLLTFALAVPFWVLTVRRFGFDEGWAARHSQIGALAPMQALVFDRLDKATREETASAKVGCGVTRRDIQPVRVRLFSGWLLNLDSAFPIFAGPLVAPAARSDWR